MKKVICKVVSLSVTEKGISKKGNHWKKSILVVEVDDAKSHKQSTLAITLLNDEVEKCERLHLNVGDLLEVGFSVFSEEFEGRWFNKIVGNFISRIDEQKFIQLREITMNLNNLLNDVRAINHFELQDKTIVKSMLTSIVGLTQNSDIPKEEKETICSEIDLLK